MFIPTIGDWLTCTICSTKFRSKKRYKTTCKECARAKKQLLTRSISQKMFKNDPEKYKDIVRIQALNNGIRKQFKNTSL